MACGDFKPLPMAACRTCSTEPTALQVSASSAQSSGRAGTGPSSVGYPVKVRRQARKPGPRRRRGSGRLRSAEKQASTLDKIKIIVGEKEGEGYTWVGPMDESELGGLWSSFGTGIAGVLRRQPHALAAVHRTRHGDRRHAAPGDRGGMLGEDVKGIAGEYVKKNLEDVKKAQADMGFDDETKTPTAEQEEKRKDVEWAAIQVQELQKAKERIEQTYVGWAKHSGPVPFNDPDGNVYPVPFVPVGRLLSHPPRRTGRCPKTCQWSPTTRSWPSGSPCPGRWSRSRTSIRPSSSA